MKKGVKNKAAVMAACFDCCCWFRPCLTSESKNKAAGMTRGVTVSTSALLDCHQCLGFESSGFSMWHFLKLVAGAFLRVLRFPPPSSVNVSANTIQLI